ncbi:MAG TPA: hypothetical protein VFV95_09175 [Vicinamibacterales bacterium]|nr:hypothetical protein [Vicinamibacterales bacterium]
MTTQTMTHVDTGKAVKVYRLVLLTSILLNIAVGFFILLFPDMFASFLGQPQPSPDTWPRHWGAQLLAINMLYMPGYWDPQVQRWPNWLGIGIRLSFALFFFTQGDGFVPMGIYDGASGLLLLLTYLRVPGAR